MNKQQSREARASFALVLVAIIWGSGFIATEYVIRANWHTPQIMVARFSVAAVIMLIALRKSIRQLSKSEIKSGIISGLFLFLSFYLQTLGQGQTTVSNAAFFTATNVVMVPFISWIFTKKRPNSLTILLTFVSLVGVAVLSYSEGKFSLGTGDLIILACALFFALHITYLETATKYGDPARLNFVQITTAAVLSLISFTFDSKIPVGFSFNEGLLPILYLGAFSTCLCYFLQTKAQVVCPATTVGVILSLEGFFGSAFSVFLGLESFTIRLLIGGGLIISASVLVNYFAAKAGTNKPSGT